MNILYIHRTQGEEPESIHILSIVKSLRNLGHSVEILGPSKAAMDSAGSNVKTLSKVKQFLPKFLFELAQIFYNFIIYKKFKDYIEHYKPDFIYERYALYSFVGVWIANKLSIPIILEVNTPYAHAWDKYYKLYFPAFAKKVEKYILNAADHVITVTEIQKGFLAEHYLNEDDISVAQNAINSDEFNPNIEPIQLNWNINDPIVIGFVGTMNRWQGIPILSDVIPTVIKAIPNAVFLLVGDGEFKATLESEINKLNLQDSVMFPGRVAHIDVPRYVSAMDITILPDSNTHGSPMKIFEYMAAKKAVIAPDVEPVREIIEHNKTGLIIDRSNSDQLSDAIIELLTNMDKRDYLSNNAYDYVTENHTWHVNASKIIDAYKIISKEHANVN